MSPYSRLKAVLLFKSLTVFLSVYQLSEQKISLYDTQIRSIQTEPAHSSWARRRWRAGPSHVEIRLRVVET